MATKNDKPKWHCLLCGSREYRKITAHFSPMYECKGCSVRFGNPEKWRDEGLTEQKNTTIPLLLTEEEAQLVKQLLTAHAENEECPPGCVAAAEIARRINI